MARRLFTSESVTEGHPDKIADQISDAILDALIKDDPRSRVAVETLVTTGLVHVAGEVTTEAYADIPGIVRERVLEIGYDSSKKGFDGASCGVSVSIGAQSPDIAQGVDDAYEHRHDGVVDELDRQGAGDQGLMYGFACDETPELMPLPIALAHRLARRLSEVRKDGTISYLRPDGKTQVTIEYIDGRPARLDTVVVSSQHAPDIDIDTLLAPGRRRVRHRARGRGAAHRRDRAPAAGQPDRAVRDRRPDGRRRPRPGARSSWTPTAGWPATAAAPSPARTRRRSTAAAPTRCAGSPRTWWRPAWRAVARCRSPTPSARRTRWACSSTPTAPETSPTRRSRMRSPASSTCGRPRSSAISTCCGRSTCRPRRTATSAGPSSTSPGSRTSRAEALARAVS